MYLYSETRGRSRWTTGLSDLEQAQEESRLFGAGRGQAFEAVTLSDTRGLAELRAQSAVITTSGGYAIPEFFHDGVELALFDASAMRRVADIERTPDGRDYFWPQNDDTSVEGVIIPENSTANVADAGFGAIVLRAYKFSSQRLLVPRELVEDGTPRLMATLGMILGRRIGRIQNRLFTNGNGVFQPVGIVPAAQVGVTAASATALAADDLISLEESLDPAYRQGASWLMHPQIESAIRKLRDSAGRYLFPVDEEAPRRMLRGYPVIWNQHMSSTIASGQRTVLFGDFSYYKIRDVREGQLKTFEESPGTIEQDSIGMQQILRSDGNLLDPSAGKNSPIQALQH
jgi:HK97 family phage major capsid protein